MRKIIVTLIIISIFTTGCSLSKPIIKGQDTDEYISELEDKISKQEDTIKKQDDTIKTLEEKMNSLLNEVNNYNNQINLKNIEINSLLKFVKNSNEDNVYNGHYHFMEINKDYVYLIKRVGFDSESENWIDELWRYDLNGRKNKLYSCNNLDFRASPFNDVITIIEDNHLVFIDERGKEIIKFDIEDMNIKDKDLTIFPYGWSDDGTQFWGKLSNTYDVNYFFNVDLDNIEVKTYDVSNLDFNIDYSLNTNTGILCYSDYPMLLDDVSEKDFMDSNKEVILKTYNLKTKEEITLDKSITKEFQPKWLNENTIEYNDPKGIDRINKNL